MIYTCTRIYLSTIRQLPYLCCIFVHISDEKPDEKWLLFDAPVDTLWIESMNSVMDDNKVLTLINGERIAMPDQVRTQLIFILVDSDCLGKFLSFKGIV